MPNTELARRILTAIKEHPEMHDQENWAEKTDCGTTMCIAGWACHLNGDKLLYSTESRWGTYAFMVHTKDGRTTIPILDRAAELLGLDPDDCDLFFCDDNDDALSELARFANGGSDA